MDFFPDDISDAEKQNFQDDNWQRVNLPHTWNAFDTLEDEKGYRRGVGCYRRQLNVNSSLRSKRIFLYFEGANQITDVYTNLSQFELFQNGASPGRKKVGESKNRFV